MEFYLGSIIETFGLDSSFFYHIAIFLFLFFALKKLYFNPFLRLFEIRHKKTVEDRLAAEQLLKRADEKLKEYQTKVSEAHISAKKEFEKLMAEAKTVEDQALNSARNEAKKITQATVQELESQKEKVRSDLNQETGQFATKISEQLLKNI